MSNVIEFSLKSQSIESLLFLLIFGMNLLILRELANFIVDHLGCGVLRALSRATSCPSKTIGSRIDLSAKLGLFSVNWLILIFATGISFFDSVSKVHLLFHVLHSTSCRVTNSEDSKVVVRIVLNLIFFNTLLILLNRWLNRSSVGFCKMFEISHLFFPKNICVWLSRIRLDLKFEVLRSLSSLLSIFKNILFLIHDISASDSCDNDNNCR